MSPFEQNLNTPPTPQNGNEAIREEREEVIKATITDMIISESYYILHEASMPEIMGFVIKNYTDERLLKYVEDIVRELGRRKPATLEGLDAKEIKKLVISTVNEGGEKIRMRVMNKANDDRNKRNGVE